MRSAFRKDLHSENLLRPYLDRCYAAHGIGVQRYARTDDQLRGMDVRLTKDGRSFIVDEKAQLHYINRSLSTFALELSLMKDGTERVGWFLDTTKRTQVYAFIFDIRVHAPVERLQQPSDIASATIVLVNRERLQSSLDHVGLGANELRALSSSLRNSNASMQRVAYPGIKLLRSDRLNEAPVNLLVARKHLMEIGQVLGRVE